MDTKQAGKLGGLKGGKSRSPAKIAAAKANAAKAREALARKRQEANGKTCTVDLMMPEKRRNADLVRVFRGAGEKAAQRHDRESEDFRLLREEILILRRMCDALAVPEYLMGAKVPRDEK